MKIRDCILLLKSAAIICLGSMIGCTYISNQESAHNQFQVTVKYDVGKATDTICLRIIDPMFSNSLSENGAISSYCQTMSSDGRYHFIIPVNYDGYFQIAKKNADFPVFKSQGVPEPLTPVRYFAVGDKIDIGIRSKTPKKRLIFSYTDRYNYTYDGSGSKKYELMDHIDSIHNLFGESISVGFDDDMEFRLPDQYRIDSAIKFLDRFKNEIPDSVYWILASDIVYRHSKTVFYLIEKSLKKILDFRTLHLSNVMQDKYFHAIDSAYSQYDIPGVAKQKSNQYLQHLFYRNVLNSFIENSSKSPGLIFERIVNNYKGLVRDKLLTYFLVNVAGMPNFASYLTIAHKLVKSEYCKGELSQLESRVIGRFGDFTLLDIEGINVKLSDFDNKVMVVDFWFTGCSGCASLYKSALSAVEENLKNNDKVIFISINVDNDRNKWLSGIRSGLYTSDLAINLNTDGQGISHPIIKKFRISGFPTLLIVKNSKIVSYNPIPLVSANPSKLKRIIEEFL